MHELLIGVLLWVGLNIGLMGLWLVLGSRRERQQVRAMVRAAELYANLSAAPPLVAALNSGHAEDAEIRHARRRSHARQGELRPF
jgi:hypothetical protein